MKKEFIWCRDCSPGITCYENPYNREKRVVLIDGKEKGLILNPIKDCWIKNKVNYNERD